jgi:hypothetical protein
MVSPGFTAWVRRSRYCAVMPWSIMAAAVRASMPSGSTTRRSAAMARSVA